MSNAFQSDRPLHGPPPTPDVVTTGHGHDQRINLPTNAVIAGTPRYVLFDRNRRIGPRMALRQQNGACSAIFGFTNKEHYESFRARSQLSLTPYPLVKHYLQSELVTSGAELKLVIVDAEGLDDPKLQAATMEDVLQALENCKSSVAASYRLTLDRDANVYAVDKLVV